MAGNCVVCSKKLKDGQRADTLYCSQKCRSAAYRSRKQVLLQLQANSLDLFQRQDLAIVASVSSIAATFVSKIVAVAGKDLADEALDAMWDLAFHCGCNFAERIGKQ